MSRRQPTIVGDYPQLWRIEGRQYNAPPQYSLYLGKFLTSTSTYTDSAHQYVDYSDIVRARGVYLFPTAQEAQTFIEACLIGLGEDASFSSSSQWDDYAIGRKEGSPFNAQVTRARITSFVSDPLFQFIIGACTTQGGGGDFYAKYPTYHDSPVVVADREQRHLLPFPSTYLGIDDPLSCITASSRYFLQVGAAQYFLYFKEGNKLYRRTLLIGQEVQDTQAGGKIVLSHPRLVVADTTLCFERANISGTRFKVTLERHEARVADSRTYRYFPTLQNKIPLSPLCVVYQHREKVAGIIAIVLIPIFMSLVVGLSLPAAMIAIPAIAREITIAVTVFLGAGGGAALGVNRHYHHKASQIPAGLFSYQKPVATPLAVNPLATPPPVRSLAAVA